MHRHPEAEVDIHTTAELEAILGAAITERLQLRVWPLSSVEQLENEVGERFVYKAQRLLTVEPALYEAAAGRTQLLPSSRVLTQDAESSTMLLEHLDQPVQVDRLGTDKVVALARDVVAAIGTLPDDLPSYLDISSTDRWQAVVDQTLDSWRALLADRRFSHDTDAVALVEQWASSPRVAAVIGEQARLANGDMKFDHVFHGPNGLQIIDWSAAVNGPPDLDLVMLLEDRSIDPLQHVDAGIYQLRWFLFLRWAIVAKADLLPEVPTMFNDWATLALTQMRLLR